MKIIKTNKDEPYLGFLLEGKKRVEGRLNKGKFKNARIGDVFEINVTGDKFEVVDKEIFTGFKEMLKKEGIGTVLPDKENMAEALQVYAKYYSHEEELKYGVIAFKLNKLN